MELASKYDPQAVESKWYQYWLDNKLFSSKPDGREPYTVVIPPPNVTGVLHMGHMLNNTIQDILVRRARMEGKNACWVPGTDHASIATEAKVVNRLAQQGIKKTDLTREEFLKHAWDWTHEHGGIILKQLRKLGASCDWDRTAFTMDETRSRAVIHVFCDLYQKGLIYRGVRMVNWDPKAQTALSDEEVIYKDEHSKLYHLKYYVVEQDCQQVDEENVMHKDEKGYYAVVATTRPETIMGDSAMCINPEDKKNTWLKGKHVIVPLVNREIPVIEDTYVDIEFGTGCLKVTPAHDINDHALGLKHGLETIDIFNDNGTISEAAGLYVGMDRMDVRKQISIDLQNAGLMEKIEDYNNKVGFSERTNVPIEPKLSTQWFLKMQHFADIALPPVMDDDIEFYPKKYKNTYRHWLENIKDWCISRQLWWGHRIPAYYFDNAGKKDFVVAETAEEALKLAQEKNANIKAEDLEQESDCLDTWFSSWLWPISLFDGIEHPDNEEINYYYPTSDLVTGPDIIFFWVARMIMAGYEYRGKMPFKHVYFTGIVRDKLGRKMSKSLGNSPDPLVLIDKFGADGVRMGMMLSAPAGNDILFDESLCEQGRNFNNKIWNAFRLVKGWETADIEQPKSAEIAVKWFDAKLLQAGVELIAVGLHAARAVLLDFGDERFNRGQAACNIGLHLLAFDGAHCDKGVHGLLGHCPDVLPQLVLIRRGGSLGQHVREAGQHPDGDVVFQIHPLGHRIQRGAVALGQLPVDGDDGIRRRDGLDGKAQLYLAAADLGGDELFQFVLQKCAGARQARGVLKKARVDAAKFNLDVTAMQQRTGTAISCHAQNHNLHLINTYILYFTIFGRKMQG